MCFRSLTVNIVFKKREISVSSEEAKISERRYDLPAIFIGLSYKIIYLISSILLNRISADMAAFEVGYVLEFIIVEMSRNFWL